MQSFSFIPLMTSEKKILNIFFENLTFWLPWQPIKINEMDKIHMVFRGLLKEHFCKFLYFDLQPHPKACNLESEVMEWKQTLQGSYI